MKRITLSLVFCASLFIVGCKNENKENELENQSDTEMTGTDMDTEMEEEEQAQTATVNLQAVSDSNLSGTLTFTEENGEVSLTGTVTGLEEGKHAIHIHEKGDCSAADGSSAGGHWNPTNEQHGKWGNDDGYHKGDIGNFEIGSNGEANIDFSTDEWCIGCDEANKNIVGKAVVIHNGVDDFTSQPSGAAGTRVGCGVIEQR